LPLIKKPFIRPVQILGIISAVAFIAPLLFMVTATIETEQLKLRIQPKPAVNS